MTMVPPPPTMGYNDILVTVEIPYTATDGECGVLTFRDRVHAHVLDSIAQLNSSGMKVTYTKQATVSVPVKSTDS